MDEITRAIRGVGSVLQERASALDVPHPHLERGARGRQEGDATRVA
jgi:hypothetical protein